MFVDRVARVTVVAALVVASGASAASETTEKDGDRVLRRRAISIDDASVSSLPLVYVAPGLATVLSFQAAIRDGGAILSKTDDLFHKLTQTDRTVVIVPRQRVKSPVNLNVTMADGTVVSFALLTRGREVDVQVDVTIALGAAADSATALKAEVASLTSRLRECQSTGASRIAELILAQGFDGPHAFDTHPIHGGDKQNRLLVRARRVYRMFEQTYLVLSVENRDPTRNWVAGRPVVRLSGGGGPDIELTVLTWASDPPEVAPDGETRVVIAFPTPQAIGARQKLQVTLQEKDGGRRFELKDLEL